MTVPSAILLVLADGRLPTGGHTHSGGVEQAVEDGRIRDTADLSRYLDGRLATTGRVDAALAAAATNIGPVDAQRWAAIDAEAAARCPVAALRAAGRSQGRGLLRVARRLWPSPVLDTAASCHPDGPLWPVALGASAIAAGVEPAGAALIAAQAAITGPAWAAVRLLGRDPFSGVALIAGLAPAIDRLVAESMTLIDGGLDTLAALPSAGGPLTDLGARSHATREVRLFAS